MDEKLTSPRCAIFNTDAIIHDQTLCSEGDPIKIYYVCPYRPLKSWPHNQRGENTKMILALQDNKDPGRPVAVDYFFGELDKVLSNQFPIAMVPSHDPQAAPAGIVQLIQRLVANNRIDAASCLVRHTKVEESSYWKNRSMEKHLSSIKVMNRTLVEKQTVLLLDDVVSSGNSMRACKKLLIDHGAAGVVCLTLGLRELSRR